MITAKALARRFRWLIALLVAAGFSGPGFSWAGGWYLVWPTPDPLVPPFVMEAFETLAACEETRGRDYHNAMEKFRRMEKDLTDEEQFLLKGLVASSPDVQLRLMRDPAYRKPGDAMAVLTSATLTKQSVCVASDDPRVRNSPMLSAPPKLPPSTKAENRGSLIDQAIKDLFGPGHQPQTPAKGDATIHYTPGRPILVTVRLNDRASARLILDTGADFTAIRPMVLLRAGVDLAQAVASGEAVGIGGTVRVSYFRLDSIGVGGARVHHLKVAGVELGLADVDGFLGRDFLNHFNVNMNATSGIVRLTPK